MTHPEPSPPHQATPDELAALYLRARDVPCPGCGYNRRDGTEAACPECRSALTISTSNSGVEAATGKTFNDASVVIACCAALLCGSMSLLILDGRTDLRDMAAGIAFFFAMCSAIIAMNRAVNARALKDQRYLRQFISILAFGIVLYSIGLLICVWEDLF